MKMPQPTRDSIRKMNLAVVAVRGGNIHLGHWLEGGDLVPACRASDERTRTRWTQRCDLDVDCPKCLTMNEHGR